ncbi:dihydroxyacetone kinase subunit DhaL [Bacillus sp. JJ1562]|uniref:dihydroxyacetone kinase subunit DhaL n=1 Tax=Bacillus sp. JJ1562 TaxID=3122960 RepID=UPI003001D762
MEFGVEQTRKWMEELNKKIQEQKVYLTDLDQAIGDGDHGLNMARGFQQVVMKISTTDYQDLGAICKDIGMTLLSKVGGASGPLYGTVFLKAANTLQGKKSVTLPEFADALSASLEGIKVRGKANVGDKTMVDVWEPVVEQMKTTVDWDAILSVAKSSMEGTGQLEAKKGRAAYLGKRSIGHLDPGAVSSFFFFEKLAEAWKGRVMDE